MFRHLLLVPSLGLLVNHSVVLVLYLLSRDLLVFSGWLMGLRRRPQGAAGDATGGPSVALPRAWLAIHRSAQSGQTCTDRLVKHD